MRRLLIPIIAFSFVFASPVVAQTGAEAVNVAVVSRADDIVGSSLVYEVKEKIRSSSGFRLVEKSRGVLMIIVNTMPKEEDNPSVSTIYSVDWVFMAEGNPLPYIIDSKMGYCGRDVVKSSARSIVASTDQVLSEFSDYMRSY
jgi:hypothetical protein